MTEEEALAVATHRHYKGGFYRALRTLPDWSNGSGRTMVLYEHVWPYAPKEGVRELDEFRGSVNVPVDPARPAGLSRLVPRFAQLRPLRCGDGAWRIAEGEAWVVAWADARRAGRADGGAEMAVALDGLLATHLCSDADHRAAVSMWYGERDSATRRMVLDLHGIALA